MEYDDEALKIIALLSSGGMRDALSIAIKWASFYENKITLEGLEKISVSFQLIIILIF
ncbi:hypothetical protein [Mycoplasmopsis cynos]|uniref:hypothetical protein n=1 Tax=Mycoplasmopsis cynos TaxID=171284 RepID=UPI003A5C82E2